MEKDGTIVVGGHHFDSPSDLAREAAFKIYYSGDQEQELILSALLETRHQLASLCGYQTFSHRAVSNSLGQTPENINMFLTSLAEQMEPLLRGEYSTMSKMKERSCTSGRPLAVWDLPYFSSMAKHHWFSLDLEAVSEYFSLGTAMEVELCLIF